MVIGSKSISKLAKKISNKFKSVNKHLALYDCIMFEMLFSNMMIISSPPEQVTY